MIFGPATRTLPSNPLYVYISIVARIARNRCKREKNHRRTLGIGLEAMDHFVKKDVVLSCFTSTTAWMMAASAMAASMTTVLSMADS